MEPESLRNREDLTQVEKVTPVIQPLTFSNPTPLALIPPSPSTELSLSSFPHRVAHSVLWKSLLTPCSFCFFPPAFSQVTTTNLNIFNKEFMGWTNTNSRVVFRFLFFSLRKTFQVCRFGFVFSVLLRKHKWSSVKTTCLKSRLIRGKIFYLCVKVIQRSVVFCQKSSRKQKRMCSGRMRPRFFLPTCKTLLTVTHHFYHRTRWWQRYAIENWFFW